MNKIDKIILKLERSKIEGEVVVAIKSDKLNHTDYNKKVLYARIINSSMQVQYNVKAGAGCTRSQILDYDDFLAYASSFNWQYYTKEGN